MNRFTTNAQGRQEDGEYKTDWVKNDNEFNKQKRTSYLPTQCF